MYNIGYFVDLIAIIAAFCAIVWMSRQQRPRILWIGLAVGLALIGALSFRLSWVGVDFYDFTAVYYRAGVLALHHDAAGLRALTGNGVRGFVNMPVVAYLFAPLGLMGPRMATAVFTAVGLLSIIVSWGLLVKLAGLERRERWLLALLFLANGPLINGLKFGNASYLVLFALAMGLYWVRTGRTLAAGALLGAAAMIKPPLLLFGVYFFLRREWRPTLSFAAVCGLTGLASLVLFGLADNLNWFEVSILQFSHSWLATFTTQSISGFVFRMTANPAVLVEWLPQHPSFGDRIIAECLTALIFVVAAAASVGAPSSSPARSGTNADGVSRRDLQYLLVVCLALVASPLSWSHYYAWLLLPTAFFLKSQASLAAPARWIGWAAIALVTPPVTWPVTFSNSVLLRLYASLAVSHLFMGGVLWFGLMAWWLSRTSGLLSLDNAGVARLRQTFAKSTV